MNMATCMQATIRILPHVRTLPKPFGIVIEIGFELGWGSTNGYDWVHVSATALGHDNLSNVAIPYFGHCLGAVCIGNVCPSAIKNLNPRRDVLGVFIIFDDRWLVQVSTEPQYDARILFRNSKCMIEGQFRHRDVTRVKVVVSTPGLDGENSRDVSVENIHERDCGSAYPAPSGYGNDRFTNISRSSVDYPIGRNSAIRIGAVDFDDRRPENRACIRIKKLTAIKVYLGRNGISESGILNDDLGKRGVKFQIGHTDVTTPPGVSPISEYGRRSRPTSAVSIRLKVNAIDFVQIIRRLFTEGIPPDKASVYKIGIDRRINRIAVFSKEVDLAGIRCEVTLAWLFQN